MRRKSFVVGILAAAIGIALAVHAWAFPGLTRQTKAACASCHVAPSGGAELTEAGKAFKADSTKVPAAGAVKGADYVGSNKCRMCHMKQHKAWLETKHAKALTSLEAADPKVVAEVAAKLKVELKGSPAQHDGCVSCHVTGFKLTGGYPAADSAKTAAVAHVGCESCHGPGSLHVSAPQAEKKKFIAKSVSARMCTQCHTATVSPAFKFEEYKVRGVHLVKTGS